MRGSTNVNAYMQHADAGHHLPCGCACRTGNEEQAHGCLLPVVLWVFTCTFTSHRLV